MKIQDPYVKGFMHCLRSEKKGTFIRHLFVDINGGNWSDAALFSQVCYIFAQLNDEGYRHYSLHDYAGEIWISLSHAQWWQVCRLNKNTVKSVIQRVKDRGLLITETLKPDQTGNRRTLIRLNFKNFSDLLKEYSTLDRIDPTLDRIDPTLDRIDPTLDRIDPTLDRIDPGGQIESIRGVRSNRSGGSDRIDLTSLYKDPEEDPERYSLRIPECAREEKCNEPPGTEPIAEPLRSDEKEKPIAPVKAKRIDEDKFSGGAAAISLVEDFPIGPWGESIHAIHPGFMAHMIANWRKGDGHRSQAFGKMADEDVRACLLKYWRKDWGTIAIDWQGYYDSTARLAGTVRDRLDSGVEITEQEQKLLVDRVVGPEHLQPRTLQNSPILELPTPLQGSLPSRASIGALPVAITGISENDLEETRRAIEQARGKLSAALPSASPQAFSGRSPTPEFLAWLEPLIEKNRIPGMSRSQTALALARRPELQKEFIESQESEHEDF